METSKGPPPSTSATAPEPTGGGGHPPTHLGIVGEEEAVLRRHAWPGLQISGRDSLKGLARPDSSPVSRLLRPDDGSRLATVFPHSYRVRRTAAWGAASSDPPGPGTVEQKSVKTTQRERERTRRASIKAQSPSECEDERGQYIIRYILASNECAEYIPVFSYVRHRAAPGRRRYFFLWCFSTSLKALADFPESGKSHGPQLPYTCTLRNACMHMHIYI